MTFKDDLKDVRDRIDKVLKDYDLALDSWSEPEPKEEPAKVYRDVSDLLSNGKGWEYRGMFPNGLLKENILVDTETYRLTLVPVLFQYVGYETHGDGVRGVITSLKYYDLGINVEESGIRNEGHIFLSAEQMRELKDDMLFVQGDIGREGGYITTDDIELTRMNLPVRDQEFHARHIRVFHGPAMYLHHPPFPKMKDEYWIVLSIDYGGRGTTFSMTDTEIMVRMTADELNEAVARIGIVMGESE